MARALLLPLRGILVHLGCSQQLGCLYVSLVAIYMPEWKEAKLGHVSCLRKGHQGETTDNALATAHTRYYTSALVLGFTLALLQLMVFCREPHR